MIYTDTNMGMEDMLNMMDSTTRREVVNSLFKPKSSSYNQRQQAAANVKRRRPNAQKKAQHANNMKAKAAVANAANAAKAVNELIAKIRMFDAKIKFFTAEKMKAEQKLATLSTRLNAL
jgi:hypothetical protein